MVRTPSLPASPPPAHTTITPTHVGLNSFDMMRAEGYASTLLSRTSPGHTVSREGVGETPTGRVAFALPIASDGAFVEMLHAPLGCVAPVPEGMDSALAAALPYPALTAHAAVHEVLRVGQGDAVFIAGISGPVGVLAAQLALAAGADVVHGLCSGSSAQDLAGMGILDQDRVVVYAYDDQDAARAALQAAQGADVILNASGVNEEVYTGALAKGNGVRARHGNLNRAYATLNGPLVRFTDELGLVAGGALGALDLLRAKASARAAGFSYDWVLYHPSGNVLSSLLRSVADGHLSPLPPKLFSIDGSSPIGGDEHDEGDGPTAGERAMLDAVVDAWTSFPSVKASKPVLHIQSWPI